MMQSNAKGVATGTRDATRAMGGKERRAGLPTYLLATSLFAFNPSSCNHRSAAPTRGLSCSRASSGTGRPCELVGGSWGTLCVSAVCVRASLLLPL